MFTKALLSAVSGQVREIAAIPMIGGGCQIHGETSQDKSAIEYGHNRRQNNLPWDPKGEFAKYKSLPLYTLEQLNEGLGIYMESKENGSWDMVFDGQNLSFASSKGYWSQRGGHVRWQNRDNL